MKVLLTTDAFIPMINGVVTSTLNLYNELTRRGHEVRILALANKGSSRREGDFYYIKSFGVKFYPNARATVNYNSRCIREILEWRPDIIHTQTEFCTLFLAKRIARKLDIPMIHTYHTLYEDYTNYFTKNEAIGHKAVIVLTKELLKHTSYIIAPTKKVKDILISYELGKCIEVIPTGLDLDKFKRDMSYEEQKKLRGSLGIGENEKVMVTVGRLGAEKNIDEIIRYMPMLLVNKPNIKFLIVGDGPYRDVLKEQVEQLGIGESVIFTGMVKPEEVYKYYRIGDLFVSASTSETQGLTYIEAMANNLPIVCKKDKCLEGVLIEGRNGYFFTSQDEFENDIIRLLEDNQLYEKVSEATLVTAQMYDMSTFGKRVEALYVKVLEAQDVNDRNMYRA